LTTRSVTVVVSPTDIWTTPGLMPSVRSARVGATGAGTGTGPAAATLRDGSSPTEFSLPYPRRPLPPKPQQRSVPSSRSAQVCEKPTVMARAVRPGPRLTGGTLAGVSPAVSPIESVPSLPRRPLPPKPQQRTAPVSRMAQVCASPAEMATALRPGPRAMGGAADALVMSAVEP
jgi:hypothetical protein